VRWYTVLRLWSTSGIHTTPKAVPFTPKALQITPIHFQSTPNHSHSLPKHSQSLPITPKHSQTLPVTYHVGSGQSLQPRSSHSVCLFPAQPAPDGALNVHGGVPLHHSSSSRHACSSSSETCLNPSGSQVVPNSSSFDVIFPQFATGNLLQFHRRHVFHRFRKVGHHDVRAGWVVAWGCRRGRERWREGGRGKEREKKSVLEVRTESKKIVVLTNSSP
jgi:hypothetical protein